MLYWAMKKSVKRPESRLSRDAARYSALALAGQSKMEKPYALGSRLLAAVS